MYRESTINEHILTSWEKLTFIMGVLLGSEMESCPFLSCPLAFHRAWNRVKLNVKTLFKNYKKELSVKVGRVDYERLDFLWELISSPVLVDTQQPKQFDVRVLRVKTEYLLIPED